MEAEKEDAVAAGDGRAARRLFLRAARRLGQAGALARAAEHRPRLAGECADDLRRRLASARRRALEIAAGLPRGGRARVAAS